MAKGGLTPWIEGLVGHGEHGVEQTEVLGRQGRGVEGALGEQQADGLAIHAQGADESIGLCERALGHPDMPRPGAPLSIAPRKTVRSGRSARSPEANPRDISSR